ncbi:MAG: UvrD/REP helicase [candidate division TM6 bacterium GW2011_GWF2_43_87]|nr:MAG: UvrD/REP helicase [candidate division TM6 bacterium GW2011_GWF2_43_87]
MSGDCHELLEKLNAQQRSAVEPGRGVILVRAGAGSGKTRVITRRISYLIAYHGAIPSSIVALTFTNKAAAEMKERVESMVSRGDSPYIGTFHAYCLRLLKINRAFLGMPDFLVLDADDQEKLMQKIIASAGLSKQMNVKSVLHALSSAKNGSIDGVLNTNLIDHPVMQQLCMVYEQEKRQSHCLDFDDLLVETIGLFKRNAIFREQFRARVRHVLVDEYQDTNRVQHALLRLMACDDSNVFCLDSLCVVGDEDQSIYSWRGATVSNILEFSRDFPQTSIVTIEQNYRSVQPLLSVANEVISHNRGRMPKKLWSEREGVDRIRVVRLASDRNEGECVTQLVNLVKRQLKNQSCAVLYRSHYQSRTLEEALVRSSQPYHIVGGIQFYERQEIKDLVAYLRLSVNPFDRVAFLRVFNTPARGLGAKFQEQFFALWDQEPLLDFSAVVSRLVEQGVVTGAKKDSLLKFCQILGKMATMTSPSSALEFVVNEVEYVPYLQGAFEREVARDKAENVRELLNAARAMEDRGVTSIPSFLDEIALLQEHSKPKDSDDSALLLMTFHAAKGLEFDTVILVGLEDGIFPTSRSIDNSYAVEEERRLLYVGITRARERLLITHVQQRYLFGRVTQQLPSPFLDEIPASLARQDDGTSWYSSQIRSYLDQWVQGRSCASARTPVMGLPSSFSWNEPFEEPIIDPFSSAKVAPVIEKSRQWKKFQSVNHRSFGVGIVKEVEDKGCGIVYLTVHFSCGVKKINSSFLT